MFFLYKLKKFLFEFFLYLLFEDKRARKNPYE